MTIQGYNEHGLPAGTEPHPSREISVQELAARLDAERATPESEQSLVLVDCREDEELRIVSFEGARHIPLARLIAQPDELEDDVPAGKDQPIAIICRSGRRSLEASLALEAMGFTDIRSVAGGLIAMSIAIDPSIPRY